MREWSERERAAFAEVDAALRTAPVAPPPPTLAPAILARLRTLAPAPRPRFRLTWLDVAIPAFIAGMAGLIYALWLSLPIQVTHRILAGAQVQWLILSQRISSPSLVPALLLGVCLAFIACLTAALLFREPRYRLSRR
jgi:hypothetical protein